MTGMHDIAAGGCGRADFEKWADRGGPLPLGLSLHVRRCPACAEQVRLITRVHASLGLLRTQAPPRQLLARANARALRMLKRAARASAAARRLLLMHPDLSRWQRAQIHLARVSLSCAAAILTLIIRVGLLSGFEHTRQATQTLAALHWDRHIDPNHEWLGPSHLA